MAVKSFIEQYIKLETFSGVFLIFIAVLALAFANIDLLSPIYAYIQHMPVGITVGGIMIEKTLLHWVNDGLMTLFFFLISLEIKREIQTGELSSMKKAMLPVLGAVGGMVIPALVFVIINKDNPQYLKGWAIPTATDIAFALGILSLLGKRVPISLKIFLTTLAVVDDLGAIIILALFYTNDLNMIYFVGAGAITIIMITLAWQKVVSASISLFLGFILWAFLLESGIHATLAGVITGMCIPRRCRNSNIPNPMEHLEHRLHGWVNFVIIPIFAFLNAGVVMNFDTGGEINTLALGILLGLFVGKQLGIFAICGLAIKTKVAKLPDDINLMQLYGVSVLCGVGFTMSLFIGAIPFADGALMDTVRSGVLSASFLSAVWGSFILFIASKR